MFLLYVNDIGEGVNSEVKLFADDCLLYRTIESESDTKQLQEDLSKPKECQNAICFGGSLINVVVPVEVIP
jgi:hypothetical protein